MEQITILNTDEEIVVLYDGESGDMEVHDATLSGALQKLAGQLELEGL